jgi:hypothetical protein
VPEKLPEEFAPTGPKLSKLPVRPPPPLQPRLFPDEARFALRLALLAGGTEFAAWVWIGNAAGRRAVVALAALRLLRPLWAWAGTRISRPALAFALLFLPLLAIGANLASFGSLTTVALIAAGLPALGDLCASCIGDRVTVERRAAAYAWLDMGQGLGVAAGLVLGAAFGGWSQLAAAAALLVASVGVMDLRDRGTPRSAWPLAVYLRVLRSPLGWQLALSAALSSALALGERGRGWMSLLAPLLGMAVAARAEASAPNAMTVPRFAVLIALAGHLLHSPPLALVGLGAMFSAIPAAAVRGAGEMERPLASSLAWSALIAGAALSAVI